MSDKIACAMKYKEQSVIYSEKCILVTHEPIGHSTSNSTKAHHDDKKVYVLLWSTEASSFARHCYESSHDRLIM